MLVGVIHDLLQVVRVLGVEHIEEVLPWWSLPSWVLVREARHQVGVLLEHGIEGLHRELIVVWNLDESDFELLQQLLLPSEHGLEEVLVEDGLVGEVKLDYRAVRPRMQNYLRCWSR